jgi:hypothetical protein
MAGSGPDYEVFNFRMRSSCSSIITTSQKAESAESFMKGLLGAYEINSTITKVMF